LPGFRVKNMALSEGLSFDRVSDRRGLLERFDHLRRAEGHKVADLDQHYQRAFELITSPKVASAFDINAEPDRLRDSYGRHMFGQSALLARRLVESGVTFVTVNCVPWDHHGTGGRYKTEPGSKLLIPPLDRAVAGLIEDLIQRGLYEKTLVVVMGEFGRTPRMNADAGRDHWGNTFSLVMGCGSMRMGQAIGKSNPRGEYPIDRPVSPSDIAATIYHHLGIDGRNVSVPDPQGRPTYLLDEGHPIRELVG
jgi:uncharacterized protein (DUF1501 family)